MTSLLISLLAGSSVSYADDEDRARQLYEEGVTFYEAGRNQEAVVAWTQAYNLSKKPLLLFNIANAHERLGNLMEAIEALDHYRAYAAPEEMVQLDARIYNLEVRFNDTLAKTSQPPTTTPETISIQTKTNWTSVSLLSAGGVGLAVSAGFGLSSLAAGGAAADLCSLSETSYCSSAAQQYLQRERNHAIIADIGLGLGLVSVGVGSMMLLDSNHRALKVHPITLPFGGGAAINGQF